MNWFVPLSTASQIIRASGIIVVLAGLTLAFLAVRQLTRAHTTLDPHGSVTKIVTDGPYCFSRNPIYLGYVCALIGLPLAMGAFWGAILSPALMLSLDQFVIRYEEAYLEQKFAKVYSDYRSRVRRWL
ncbi:MAG: hypothetical protein A2Z03_03750 [Chloroflexi bacterium RBG_16_56_8]|nr:MAG: hypothetical protein A2Z03_03750 [Chloroflexi bacterium RBG_16_56_8]